MAPAGDCEAPLTILASGAPDPVLVRLEIEPDNKVFDDIEVRCRKCPSCLRYRRRVWTARARSETLVSDRTWFGTLTFEPAQRVRFLYRAHFRCERRRCEPWHLANEADQFKMIVSEMTDETQKFLKRVRKNSGARLRYLIVAEAHKDGFPHFHILVHESSGRVSKRILEAAWKVGFTNWRLVDIDQPNQVGYVTKYLAKSALTRPLASQRYGRPQSLTRALAERLEAASNALGEVTTIDTPRLSEKSEGFLE